MNPLDFWSLALVPGLAALGWSFRNALRIQRIERELSGRDGPGPVLIRVPTLAGPRRRRT